MEHFEHVRTNLAERMLRLREATADTRVPVPEVCDDCKGTGWVTRVSRGVRRAHRCSCWYPRQAARATANAGVPARHAKCTFDNFTSYENEDLGRAIRRSRRFARDFPAPQQGLLLAGPSGIGKTHLAIAILNECTGKGLDGQYCDTAALLSSVRGSYDSGAETHEQEILQRCSRTSLLVLDELGEEHLTRWAQETLSLIINTRCNENRATVCVTRLSPNVYAKESLLWQVGGRVLSLLHEMCDVIEFDGADYRRAGKHATAKQLEDQWSRQTLEATPPPAAPAGSTARKRHDDVR